MARRRKTDPKIATAYVRVSTDRQELGPEAQRAAITAWAQREGVAVASWHEDLGVSGTTPADKRPGFLAAFNAMQESRAGVLVAAKRDRLARDVVIAATIESLVRDLGARVLTADGLDFGDGPEGQFMRTILDATAMLERARIAARTKAALAAKRARGERAGALPFGFELDTDDPSAAAREDGRPQRLRPSVTEQLALAEMRRLRAKGLTQEAIAAELNRQRRACRGQRWTQSSVARVLARASNNAGPGGAA